MTGKRRGWRAEFSYNVEATGICYPTAGNIETGSIHSFGQRNSNLIVGRPLCLTHSDCLFWYKRKLFSEYLIDFRRPVLICRHTGSTGVHVSGMSLLFISLENLALMLEPTLCPSNWNHRRDAISQVHHSIHRSPPPVPILSQLDPIYTPSANLPKIHSDPILPSTPWSS
jgi:hypothetical protein